MARPLEYREIPITQIVALGNGKFSARQGNWMLDDEFIELKQSIELYGQIEPIGVMLLPDTNFNARYRYDVLYGFRRYAALRKIAEETQESTAVRVLVYEDVAAPDARIYQTIQALTTQPMKAPDLALNLRMISDIADPPLNDQRLAYMLGISEAYAYRLLRIARNGSKELLHRWSHDATPLPVDSMFRIVSSGDIDRQTFEYELEHSNALQETPDDDDVVKRIDDLLNAADEMQQDVKALKELLSADTKGRIAELEALDDGSQSAIVQLTTAMADNRNFLKKLRDELRRMVNTGNITVLPVLVELTETQLKKKPI